MAEHRVRKNNIIYIIPTDELFIKWKNDEAFIDEYGRLMNRKPHRVLKELKHYVADSVVQKSYASPIKDLVRDKMVEYSKYAIDRAEDVFFYEVIPNVWHKHIVPLWKGAKDVLFSKELKIDQIKCETEHKVVENQPILSEIMTKEEVDAEKRKLLYHWIGLLSSLTKLQNAGELDVESTLAQLTEPMMIERVNALLSENPNLLETDKYILLHSLLGRDLYMEGRLIPIRATEINMVAKNNGGLKMEGQMTFEFDKRPTIKGYPELRWTGKRPYESTQYYPAQLRERYGEETNGWINKIFWGDNLQVMSHLLKEYRGEIDLIYIDPPFDSKADYKKSIRIKSNSATSDTASFEEKQYGDIWNNDGYLQFMYERLIIMRELLSDSGTLYLHCDWHQSSHLRCILDELFGPMNCHNVITWKRSHAQGNAGQGTEHFGIVTDTIFIYSKTGHPIWNQQYLAYSKETIERDYKYIDEVTGERYRLTPVDGPGGASKGNPYYEFLGVSGYWRYSKETMQSLYEAGEIQLSSTGKSLSRRRYLKDAKGTPVTDLWDDLNRVSPTSSERLDYPTQKPECLLERIMRTSSNPESLVFDCFMGSGTTQAVAMKLGRKFIGADINLGSIQTTTKRLINVAKELDSQLQENQKYTGFEVYNVNNYDFFRNPLEARDLIIQALEIQPFPQSDVWDGELDGRMVKIMPVNRIATKADLEELKANLPYKHMKKERQIIRLNL